MNLRTSTTGTTTSGEFLGLSVRARFSHGCRLGCKLKISAFRPVVYQLTTLEMLNVFRERDAGNG